MLATTAPAQTFTTLHNFTASRKNFSGFYTNSDGSNPIAGLLLSGNVLYGTAATGGRSGSGTVFAVNTDGTGFTNLHPFTATSGGEGFWGPNGDGADPQGALIMSGNILYGTAAAGGFSNSGAVFAVNNNGASFSNLYSFTGGNDGYFLKAGLILLGNTLYGTAYEGGTAFTGTVFAVNTDGAGFTNLHSFSKTSFPSDTNSDGADPIAELVLSGNTLYGTAPNGGPQGGGTVFAVNTDGTGFTNLHDFTATSLDAPYTNSDGANPVAGLVLSGDTLYGVANGGGSSGTGAVFALQTDGTGFTNLHSFTAATSTGSPHYLQINSDGVYPESTLVLSGNTLYGSANGGGSAGTGTLFAVNTNGTDFATLYSFSIVSGSTAYPSAGTNSDGDGPVGKLIISGNTLYGTANAGGSAGAGTVFSLSFPSPQLAITASDTNVILTWPANVSGFSYSGYTLQSTTNLGSPAAWSTVAPGPVVVNGLFTLTNTLSGTKLFYRLGQ